MRKLWFGFGVLTALLTVSLAAQTVIRSNATQFPSVRVETNGTNGAPSISFLNATTKGFFRFDASSIGLAGHLVPGADGTYDLGSSSFKFRNFYLSGSISGAGVLFGDGSAGSPSISFASAPTKGFYKNDANTIGVSGFLGAGADATYDIGLAATKRFRNGFFSGLLAADSVQIGAGVPATSNLLLSNDGGMGAADLAVMAGDGSAYVGIDALIVDTQSVVLDTAGYPGVQPPCSSTTRGTLWFVLGASGVADQFQVCGKSADGAFSWVTVQ